MTRTQFRPLAADDEQVLALAVAAGPHGVYVHNALAIGEGEGFVCGDERTAIGAAWFGPRGNLVVLGDDAVLGASATLRAFVDAILRQRRPWRIAMGPASIIEALRERAPSGPLLCREQIYYCGHSGTANVDLVDPAVRNAERPDRDRLVQATLLLNASDLNIDPERVDRRWLRDTIDERIADGTTRVTGPLGAPGCKLDLGSDGPAGIVLEGVFTFPELRGRGAAASLVATCLSRAKGVVSLHVGKHNRPARAAYERAGMHECGSCRLLLLG